MAENGVTRRDALKAAGGVGVLAAAGATGLYLTSSGGGENAATEPLADDETRQLADRFAPTLYFDSAERWFPTDPRSYERDQDGQRVVDGFAALDGYHSRFRESGAPPEPTVFYNGVRYADSSLGVVQFWLYSAFDQFTTNFHWHDWELLQVFVDLETREPQLYVASAHSRKVPNNEFLDPEVERPRILPELGSHSSAISVNDQVDSFQRLSAGDTIADITNRAIGVVEQVAELPAAYGLPRDEGARLPFVVPELDGEPIYDHPDLPNVERADLVPQALTVRSFADLTAPPSDLPGRETGTVFAHPDADVGGDVIYDLVPTAELEHVDAFVGPQLSFEFAVPEFVEDAVASHITATGTPWKQPRYVDPASDVTEAAHSEALADRYDAIAAGSVGTRIVAGVQRAISDPEAPEDEGVTAESLSVEGVVLLESDPEAVPTFRGATVLQDVAEGEHRMTVNVAGTAPYSERLRAEGTTTAGVEGAVTTVANEDAVKLRVDTEGTEADVREVAVEDDFGGRLYESRVDGPDAAYVHRGGAYTTEVRDADGALGAFRVNPDPESETPVTVERPDTGKASLARYLGDLLGETEARVREDADVDGDEDGDEDSSDDDDTRDGGRQTGTATPGGSGVRGLLRALDATATAAERAAEAARAGDRGNADERLGAVETRLERIASALENARGDLSDSVAAAVERRLDQARTRTEQARESEKL